MSRISFTILLTLFLTLKTFAGTPRLDIKKAGLVAKQALFFCKQKGYNTHYCILIDMSLPSGVKRFMVWDLVKKDTLFAGLISHGCGRSPWSGMWSKDKPEFSNRDGSHCTALGKYLINNRAYSNWGVRVKYVLIGLDTSNNNALKRQIVFHSWESVPEKEVYPQGTPEGWGCPAISNNVMKRVDALLKKQHKRVLLWIYR